MTGLIAPPPGSCLAPLIRALRQQIAIVDVRRIEALVHLDAGAQAIVYADPSQQAVYKLVETQRGRLLGGLHVEQFAVDPDGGIRITRERTPTVIDLLERVRLGNRHGGLVYTEIGGVTAEGTIILKQPYILGLHRGDWLTDMPELRDGFSLTPVSMDDQVAATEIDGRVVLFSDLHEENLMRNEAGRLFIVDSPAASLNERDSARVREAAAVLHERLGLD